MSFLDRVVRSSALLSWRVDVAGAGPIAALIVIGVVAVVLEMNSAVAQSTSDLKPCRAIADNLQRLECYDKSALASEVSPGSGTPKASGDEFVAKTSLSQRLRQWLAANAQNPNCRVIQIEDVQVADKLTEGKHTTVLANVAAKNVGPSGMAARESRSARPRRCSTEGLRPVGME